MIVIVKTSDGSTLAVFGEGTKVIDPPNMADSPDKYLRLIEVLREALREVERSA